MAAAHHDFNAAFATRLAKNLRKVLSEVEGSLDQNTAAGALARGKVFEIAKNKEMAISSYEEALRLNDSGESLARLVIARIQAGQYDKALNEAVALAEQP